MWVCVNVIVIVIVNVGVVNGRIRPTKEGGKFLIK